MPDIVVVGAGLAGAAATKSLTDAGFSVVVLEARERLGGRGYVRRFAGSTDDLDFGGAWITPWHARIRALCAEYGIPLRPRTPITSRRWFYDGALHHDGPTSPADRPRHERALARIAADAMLLKMGHADDEKGRRIADISFADYLNRLDPPQSTRDLLSAWWTVSGNADKSRAPAGELLGSSVYGEGLTEAMTDAWTSSLVGGVTALVEKMLADQSVRLGSIVQSVRYGAGGVAVTLHDGETLPARAAILATGLNPLAGIAFDPPLPPQKAEAIQLGHLGRAVKIWAKVRGVAPGILATGGGTGIEFLFSERTAADGTTLLVGFGVAGPDWTPNLPHDAEAAVARLFPEAEFLVADWHDWNADPFARGTWVAGIVGAAEAHAYPAWRRHGRLAFASSDIAPEQAGWFEAAAISGEAAAAEIQAVLAASPSSQ